MSNYAANILAKANGFANLEEEYRAETAKLEFEQAKKLADQSEVSPHQRAATAKLVWTGTNRELADWILAGKFESKSQMNALEQGIAHVERKDGKALVARNLHQSLMNRKGEGK